jgi:hypothetical protein
VDALVGELMDSLKKAQVLDAINIIVTGLHGFAEVQTHSFVYFFASYNLGVRIILFHFMFLTRVLIHN